MEMVLVAFVALLMVSATVLILVQQTHPGRRRRVRAGRGRPEPPRVPVRGHVRRPQRLHNRDAHLGPWLVGLYGAARAQPGPGGRVREPGNGPGRVSGGGVRRLVPGLVSHPVPPSPARRNGTAPGRP
jgi:hypothetical protein